MTLKQYIEKEDFDGLFQSLGKLSNSEFRRSEKIIRDAMTSLPNDSFWNVYYHLVEYRKQSFLSCIMSIGKLAKNNDIDFSCPGAQILAEWLNKESPESVVKILRMAIPFLTTEEQMDGMRKLFGVDDDKQWISILIKEDTPLAYYLLFKALSKIEDRDFLLRCCIILMKKNNDISYNMTSILKSYFGLDTLKTTLSLQIEPYELSYLDKSYENFIHILQGKRPRL